MSVRSVAKKDFTGARRSASLWAAGVMLAVVAVLLGFVNQGFRQTDVEAVQSVFLALTQLLGLLLPIIALTVTYMSIAGEREGGGIKFLLSLPNTRRDVFTGKLLSRLVIVAAGVVFTFVAASAIAVTKHGAFPITVAVGTLLMTVVYGSVFVSIATAVSAAAATRSRAIASALAAYFLLVLLYVFPMVQVKTVVQTIHTSILGMGPNVDLYNAVHYTSPYMAYQKAVNLVVPAELERKLFRESARNLGSGTSGQPAPTDLELPIYLTDEFSLVILAFWLVVPALVGYWAFNRADLE